MLFLFSFNTSIEQIAHAERPATTTTDGFQFLLLLLPPQKIKENKESQETKINIKKKEKKRDQIKKKKIQSEFKQQTMRRGKNEKKNYIYISALLARVTLHS